MSAVLRYAKPNTWREALAAKAVDPAARWLAGGTFILAGDYRDKPESLVDIGSALPRGIERSRDCLEIGAGTSFQELADAAADAAAVAAADGVPRCLGDAALTMMNRNTRNRATLGGNLGANKSCSSLLPILLVLGAELEIASPAAPEPERLTLERWLDEREASPRREGDLVLRVFIPTADPPRAAYRRWNRVACDLSVIGAAAAYRIEASPDGDRLSGIRIALGGLGPKARRRPDLEKLFEGRSLPSREEIEAAAAPLLSPISDLRASAEFKRLRCSQILADAILDASADESGQGGRK